MPDINWNGDAASAPYISRYDQVNDNLVLAETNAGTVLLEYDGTQWNATNLDVEQLGADSIQSGSVKTGDINNVVYLDPDQTNQFGSRLQTAIDAAAPDGTVVVPPAAYDFSGTTAVIDNRVTVTSPASDANPSVQDMTEPWIDVSGTTSPVIRTESNGGSPSPSINGLWFQGDGTRTLSDSVIECRWATTVTNCIGFTIGDGIFIRAQTTDSTENVNGSQFKNVAANTCGRVLSIEDPGGQNNINSIQALVPVGRSCSDTVIYNEGTSNQLTVNLVEGSVAPRCGIDMSGQRSIAVVWRNESDIPSIKYNQVGNFGVVGYHTFTNTDAHDYSNASNNRGVTLVTQSSFVEFSTGFTGFQFRGDSIRVTEPGEGVITQSPDGTQYRIYVENDGTVTSELV